MNIVFVMMVVSSHEFWAPTLEFGTKSQCEDAVKTITAEIKSGNGIFSQNFGAMCVAIKK